MFCFAIIEVEIGIYEYLYIYLYIYIGIAHIVHEACSYSLASSVMEHVLAVHSVIWYRPLRDVNHLLGVAEQQSPCHLNCMFCVGIR